MSMLVCVLCVCLSLCPQAYLWKHMHNLYKCFCACCLWPCLGPPASDDSQGEAAVLGFSSPLTMHCNAFAARGIIWSPITSCSRSDHCVAAVFTANGTGREGDDESALCRRSVIYDWLVHFWTGWRIWAAEANQCCWFFYYCLYTVHVLSTSSGR